MSRDGMEPLDFLSQEELTRFFHCKKTEISCMEEPHTFLNQLRDHNLVPEDLYKKVIKMKCKTRRQEGVYEILDRMEKQRGQCVKLFWTCVFKNHILQKYPVLRSLRNSLLDGSFRFDMEFPDADELSKNEHDSSQSKEDKADGQMGGRKRKKCTEETEEEPGPSSISNLTQKKADKKPTFIKEEEVGIWMLDCYKSQLPVTCGDKKGTLYRDKLAKGYKSIQSQGRWFTASEFEKFAGKGNGRNWKKSIFCQNTSLKTLIEEGHLRSPSAKRYYDQKNQKIELPVSSLEAPSPLFLSWCQLESVSSVKTEESCEDHEEERKIKQEEEEDSKPGDLPTFNSLALPVSCGSVSETLDKGRFTAAPLIKIEEVDIRTWDCYKSQLPDIYGDKEGTLYREKLAKAALLMKVEEVGIWMLDCYKSQLPVSCGDKEGTLYRDKLAKGYKSIQSQGRWFTASEFETFAGKGNGRNWKQSIFCQNTPLQTLIEEGHLQSPSTRRCYDQKNRKIGLPFSSLEAPSPRLLESVSSVETDESSDDYKEEWKLEQEEEEEEVFEFEVTPLIKGEKADIWMWDCYKSQLPVTCGDKEGTLYPDKLAKGYKSIQSQGRWFTASEFETFGGKGNGRNWKQSIFCQNTPLQTLIEEGHLQSPSTKRCYDRKNQKIQLPVGSLEAPSPQSLSVGIQTEEPREDHEVEWKLKQEEEEEDSKPVDLPAFNTLALPVSCGSVSEALDKSRFAITRLIKEEMVDIWTWDCSKSQLPVTCGDKEGTLYQDKLAKGYKSIQSQGRWFTASEFEKFAGKGNGRNWKQSIFCQNTSLKTLIEEGHLQSPSAKPCYQKNQIIQLPVSSLEALSPPSPLIKVEMVDIWMLDCYKSQLPVTCGDKEGTLYRDKLAKGYKSIQSQDRWFTANEFERFAGNGNGRNWKQSIFCQNTPLQTLIEEGHLQSPGSKKHDDQKNQKILLPVSSLEAPSPSLLHWCQLDSISGGIKTEGSTQDQEEEWKLKQEEEEEEDSEHVDLSKFNSLALPVSCGSVSGTLYKDRFAGSRSKSIRTEERWFTPEEFVKQELTLTDRNWEKDILCHGKTLNYLVKKKILCVHPEQCRCRLCCPEDSVTPDTHAIRHLLERT